MDQRKIDVHFLRLAHITALNLSKDPKTKVGSVVVTSDGRQFSTGYNGFPEGVLETPERWTSPEKYEWVVHAEINAIFNCPFDTKGCTIYCTIQPCHRCLGHLKNAKILTVVYNKPYINMKRQDIWDELAKDFQVRQVNDPMLDRLTSLFEAGVAQR